MTQPAEVVIAGRRIRLASAATATAVAVVILLLAAALVPLLRIAGQYVLSNVSQDAPFLPVAAVGLVVARPCRDRGGRGRKNAVMTTKEAVSQVREAKARLGLTSGAGR